MSAPLVLHELTGSPNSVKVRIALGHMGLEYERRPVDFESFPGDRSEVVAISRQPRVPVLQHGDAVIPDSAAILRYLSANFPESPSLYSEDYMEQGEIEQWEAWGRAELSPSVGMIFGECMSPEPNLDNCKQASAMIHEITGKLESELEGRTYLVGDRVTAADIALAPVVKLAAMSDHAATTGPISAFFHANFQLGDGRDRTREWMARLMKHDAANPYD
ncbi:MAG: glutathione S-transferase family protein [Acidobacteriota bacterium]